MPPAVVRRPAPPAPLVALCGWLVPGLGYVLIGERARGVIVGVAIGVTFLLGLLIGGVRVVDVPGYDADGLRKPARAADGRAVRDSWALSNSPLDEIFNKPWYIAQTLAGPVNAVATWGSLKAAAAGHHTSTARLFDIGTLYTAVAGMLNLLVILDATYRATRPPGPNAPPPPPAEPSRAGVPTVPAVPSLQASATPPRSGEYAAPAAESGGPA